MGARSNIVVQEQDGSRIWLYGHWMGEDSITVTLDVLSMRERWNDAPYLTRMLFEEMIQGAVDKTTGFGISTVMCDNEYPIIVLEPHTQTAWLEDSDWSTTPRSINELTEPVSFENFLNALSFCDSRFEPLMNSLNALAQV